ncbi:MULTISPECIES: hypothetical protein [Deinococcus]|uniref:hypothetical protein n=1 Tax=Deinococcus TaxID=1298 RepID=UPI00145DD656|nr:MULTISPECIES: hypothetical protein [Deinococcus]MCY1702369.1 hypothetical protein [Deinococcus sp. SL84]
MNTFSYLLIFVAGLGAVAAIQNAYKADDVWLMLGHGAFALLCLFLVVRELRQLFGR